MRRVEAVLGKGWESHVDGQKLKADGDSFRLKLSTQELFEDWSRKVILCCIVSHSRFFDSSVLILLIGLEEASTIVDAVTPKVTFG